MHVCIYVRLLACVCPVLSLIFAALSVGVYVDAPQVEALYNEGERDQKTLEEAAAAVAESVGAKVEYLTFCRQADGVLVSEVQQGPPGGPQSPPRLPDNDDVSVAIGIKAAPMCCIVDNYVLSDTHK